MTTDARFEDAEAGPLRLRALDAEDLTVMAGLCQDAVLTAGDISYHSKDRSLALLLNRLRREDRQAEVERVRAVLLIEDVQAVRGQGLRQGDRDTVLSLLDMRFAPGPDGTGTLHLIFAGDGELAVEVEALELLLRDVTRPYRAVSGQMPDHGL